MKTKRNIALALTAALAFNPLANQALAGGNDFFLGALTGCIGLSLFASALDAPARSTTVVYSQPAPVVYHQPAPVVVAPAPIVYHQPAPVVVAPAPVIVSRPAPVVVARPAPVIVAPRPAPVIVQQRSTPMVVTQRAAPMRPMPAPSRGGPIFGGRR